MSAVNHVPLIDQSKSRTGCCTLIEPNEWDDQEFVFDNKLFAKARVRSFMHIPLNMSAVMRSTQAQIVEAGAEPDETLILSYEASPWYNEQYFAISKEVPGLDMQKLSGTFLAKVFEGPYRDAAKWHQGLVDYAISKGKTPLRTYFFYTTCPKCSKYYGKNYVVGFEQIA